tara:strand:- start:1328 stop:1753 length:426 start_codon:yes stop_codon:yes gene_type:complete
MSKNMKTNEFLFFGMNVERLSFGYGLFLIVWGAAVSYLSQSVSMTSYIPSFMGMPVLIFSSLAILFPNRKKLFMHITATFVLLIALGGLDVLRGISSLFENFWADLSKLMLLLSGLGMTYLNVKSFIYARKVREDIEQGEI